MNFLQRLFGRAAVPPPAVSAVPDREKGADSLAAPSPSRDGVRPPPSRDPTRTGAIRRAFRQDVESRLRRLKIVLREMLQSKPTFGMPVYRTAQGFDVLLREATQNIVIDRNGYWMDRYIREAYELGAMRAREELRATLGDAGNPYHVSSGEHGGEFTTGETTANLQSSDFGDPTVSAIPANPAYAYHATNIERAFDIRDGGTLDVHKPSYGTDQSSWPDGSTEKRSYWTHDPNVANSFYPEEGKPALLRVLRTNVDLKKEGTGDLYLTKKVPVRHLEFYSGDGVWKPLAAPKQVKDNYPSENCDTIVALAQIELQGATDAMVHNASREMAKGLLGKWRDQRVYRAIVGKIDEIGKVRLRALVSTYIVRAFNAAKLDVYEAGGIAQVGILAETRPNQHSHDHALFDARAKIRKRPPVQRRFKTKPGPAEQAKLERREAKLSKLGLVEVLTAGDDDVCDICEAIEENGPYTIDEARSLIPAHPNCRCAFIPYRRKE